MRIIGGDLGGRILRPPMKGWPTRPTTDQSKEALYNILSNSLDFTDLKILDLFGGTGAHSLECISRGSVDVTYVDQYGKCIKWMKQITMDLDISDRIKIIKRNVKKFLIETTGQYDFIFADPPYQLTWLAEIPDMIANTNLLTEGGIFVMEHDNQYNFEDHITFEQQRKYGQSLFSFFTNENQS